MMPRATFPWGPMSAGSALLLLALLTVSIRVDVLCDARALYEGECERTSLLRRTTDLETRLQARWHAMGAASTEQGPGTGEEGARP